LLAEQRKASPSVRCKIERALESTSCSSCKIFRRVTSKQKESLRLGVITGWYSTKVSGTFVSGPHESEADCLRKIAEINPPPAKGSKGAAVM